MIEQAIPHDVLDRVPIFARMTALERGELADVAEICHYEVGQTLLQEGGRDQVLWIVLEGQCEVFLRARTPGSRETIVLALLEPYSSFGEMSFFHAAPHSASVRTLTPARFLRLARGHFDDLVRRKSFAPYKLADNTIRSLAERLRRMDDWVARLVTEQAAQGRASELARLGDKLLAGWKL